LSEGQGGLGDESVIEVDTSAPTDDVRQARGPAVMLRAVCRLLQIPALIGAFWGILLFHEIKVC